MAEAFDNERRFTADAAHELRTPLAALKIQAQVARRAQTVETQQHALSNVIAGVDRMTHLVEQLLTLARVDPTTQSMPPSINPAPIIATLCTERQYQARQQGQTLVFTDAAAGCSIAVSRAWLEIASRNLVDNALRYAGENARIEVSLTHKAPHCLLSVADNGPGVACPERDKLSGRFVRGESETESEGCGLGLSIVSRIAQLSHARFELADGLSRADGGHGLAAILRFNATPLTP